MTYLSLKMFIKRSISKRGDKTYVSHLLVESVVTPAGPRHRTICNLGKMDPGPKEDWLELAERIQAALGGQDGLFPDARVDQAVRRVRERQAKATVAELETESPMTGETAIPDTVVVKPSGVRTQDLREAGPLHVGHQKWQRLQLDAILKAVKTELHAREKQLSLGGFVRASGDRETARLTASPFPSRRPVPVPIRKTRSQAEAHLYAFQRPPFQPQMQWWRVFRRTIPSKSLVIHMLQLHGMGVDWTPRMLESQMKLDSLQRFGLPC